MGISSQSLHPLHQMDPVEMKEKKKSTASQSISQGQAMGKARDIELAIRLVSGLK